MSLRCISAMFVGVMLSLASASAWAAPRPDVLLIVVDDLGYGDLSCYGAATVIAPRPGDHMVERCQNEYPFPGAALTPNLDTLAQGGVRFTQFYGNGAVCSPSRVALMTGMFPQRFGVRRVFREESARGLPHGTETLASVLRFNGYVTHHVGKWHLGNEGYNPLDYGYESFYGFFHEALLDGRPPPNVCGRGQYCNPVLWEDRNEISPRPTGHLTKLLSRRAAEILRSLAPGDPPQLVTLWYLDPHVPLLRLPDSPPPSTPYTRQERYQAMVSILDEEIGEVIRSIGSHRDTLIFFMSDNGGEQGCVLGDCIHPGPRHNPPFKGAKGSFYEGGIRVPAFLHWDAIKNGEVRVPVAGFDLLPTLVDLLDLNVQNPPMQFDGQSFACQLANAGQDPDVHLTCPPLERSLVWEDHDGEGFSYAVRSVDTRWKLLHEGGPSQLFEMTVPNATKESQDVSGNHPWLVATLEDGYRAWREVTSRIHVTVRNLEGDVTTQGPGDWLIGTAPNSPGGAAKIADEPLLNPDDGALSVAFRAQAHQVPGPEGSVLVGKGSGWGVIWSQSTQLEIYLRDAKKEWRWRTAKQIHLKGAEKRIVLTLNHEGEQGCKGEGEIRLYVDGIQELIGWYPEPIVTSADDVRVGSREGFGMPYRGRVRDLQFFNVNLVGQEVDP